MNKKNTLSDINFQISLEDLFDTFDLEDIQSFLHGAMETCMTSDNHLFGEAKKRSDFFFCYKQLVKFFEVADKYVTNSKETT
ncbi:hypothetical protein [Pinibacter aurantiacus]|uniref:Uncharacterized protein n=1 Tax=Pinibacter aurantiacus TaxID=2851599 RepID=A0A9E2W3I3_9BACT|nr:hypothetical protein [Pinibacter aurantiacus]MBV4356283.1 hypothetical protein [Pinibacter aurantiacus]